MADLGIARKQTASPVATETSVSVAALRGALKVIGGIVERRKNIPILSTARLQVSNGRLNIRATDLDIYASTELPAEGGDFAVAVDARLLANILREIPGGDIQLSVEDAKLSIVAATTRYSLFGLAADDFPEAPHVPDDVSFEMDGHELAAMIDAVRFAISTEETRYYLNGIYLHVSDEAQPVLKAAATDGHRLARVTVPRPDGAQGMPGVIIPRKTVSLIRSLAAGASKVRLTFSGTKMRAEIDDYVIVSKLIDGTFPDYTRVIPTRQDHVLTFDPADMRGAIKRVGAIGSERLRGVKLIAAKGRVEVSHISPENGKATDSIAATVSGGPFDAGFNIQYIQDILANCIGEAVDIAMADSASPALITDQKRPELVQVLMPMRL